MKKLQLLLVLPFLFQSCNDGDLIVTSFDFEDATLETCGTAGGYVFFKINSSSNESISLQLSTTDILFVTAESRTFTLDGSSNFVNYRTYSEAPTNSYFCSNVPPTTPTVTIDYLGASGIAKLITETVFEDNDGVEETNITIDTDKDGLANYYDFDDDGDNVPTATELGSDPSNPRDTDGDTIPDYLDKDDDGDGILTRNEDANSDLDPTNDITDLNIGADYLNSAVANQTLVNQYRPHSYTTTSSIKLSLANLVLGSGTEEITKQTLNLGEKQGTLSTTVTVTPPFAD